MNGEQFAINFGKKALKKSVRYLSNGYEYATDIWGRITSVKGNLLLNSVQRNKYAQRILDGKGLGDDAGHLIASIFNGSGEIDNMLPMNGTLNKGQWRRMENIWANALLGDKSVEVIIEAVYPLSGGNRPLAFQVGFSIDNKVAEIVRFINN